MNNYVDNFNLIFNKKENIQVLRNKVLVLAIQGKLTQNSSNYDIAEVIKLKELIIFENNRLVELKQKKHLKVEVKIDVNEEVFEAPKNWVWIRFGLIATFRKGPFGSSITKSMFVPKSDTSYKVYEQKNAIQKNSKIGEYHISEDKFKELSGFEVHPNDIIVSCAGTIGETYVLPNEIERGIINQALMKVSLSEYINKEYFLYYFDYVLLSHIKDKSNGSAMKNIPAISELNNIPIPLPTLDEQNEIVKEIERYNIILNQLEEKLVLRETILKKLPKSVTESIASAETSEELKFKLSYLIENFQTVYQTPESMQELRNVVLQLAIEGKLTEQLESEGNAKEVYQKYVKTQKGKDLPFHKPESWAVLTANELCDKISYGYTASSEELDTGVRLLRITDIQNGKVNWDTVPFCTIESEKIDGYKLNENDIVIARTGGTVGKSYIIKDISVTSVFASYLIRMIPIKELNIDYYYLYLSSPYYWEQLLEGARGAAQPNVNAKTLGNLIVPLPPLAEQQRIVDKVNSIMHLIDQLEQELKHKQQIITNLAEAE